MAIAAPTAGNRIVTSDLAAFYNLLKGVSGSGEAITLIHNAAASLIFQPSSDPAAGTEAVQIKNNAGTVQSALSFDGRFYAADGAVGTPGFAFESDKDNGLFRNTTNDISIVTAGADRIRINASGEIGLGVTPVAGHKLVIGGIARINGGSSLLLRNASDNANVALSNSGGSGAQELTITAGNGIIGAASFLSIGTTPATTGVIRVPNAQYIYARNAANSADRRLIGMDGVNQVFIDGEAGGTTFGGIVLTTASAAGSAGLRVPHGTAPSSPTNGDIWTTTAGLYVRINGATVGPLA